MPKIEEWREKLAATRGPSWSGGSKMRIALEGPDAIFAPRAELEKLERAVDAALKRRDFDAADVAEDAVCAFIKLHGDKHRQSVMASAFRSPEAVIAAIEKDGRRLKLAPDGGIDCQGGAPGERERLALLHYQEAVRGILAARDVVVRLVGAPAPDKAA